MADSNAPNTRVPAAQQDPLIGKVLDSRFTILERIGSGGMGRVYKARQAPLDRIVALKVLNPSYSGDKDPNFKRRFFLEASLTAKLKHPNTIQIIDYGEVGDEVFYIAMEYLEGQTLSAVLTRTGPLPWKRALNIAQQIARALREAHRAGIIHRDLKPANVMLVEEDNSHDLVKVLDFGLVKAYKEENNDVSSHSPEMTQAGVILGSAQYMAPEQAHGHGDPRADIYSLGVVLYHMLMGRPPFTARDSMDVIVQHHTQPPPPFRQVRPQLEVPPEVEGLVMRCLAKKPEGRFADMDALLETLRQVGGATGSGVISGLRTGTLPAVGDRSTSQVSSITSAARARLPPAPGTSGVHPSASTGAYRTGTVSAARTGVVAAAAPPPPKRKGPAVAVGAVVGVLALAGAGVLLLGKRERPTAVAPAQPPPSARPAPEAAAAEAPEAAASASSVVFIVDSDPAGATVTYRGRTLGVTPLTFSAPADEGGRANVELSFSLAGFETESVQATGQAPEMRVNQMLKKRAAPPPPPPKPSPAPAKKSGTYKDDPY
jgi:serine/threonine-protein kinase